MSISLNFQVFHTVSKLQEYQVFYILAKLE